MAGHRNGRPRRDKARAERMQARIAASRDELQALGHAFDWLRMELAHLGRAAQHDDKTQPHAAEAGAIAREVMRELVSRTEYVIKRSEDAQ